MKGFKKLTAGFLGVVMALGVCGFTALAEGDTSTGIDSMEELTTALGGEAETLEIAGDINVTGMVSISRDVVINGNDHKLTFTGSDISGKGGGQNSFIQITGDVDVKINGLTIDGKNSVRHCINVFGNGEDTKVALDKVTMKNGGKIEDINRYGYGLVVNSADVTIKNVTTEENCGGINVDTAGGKKSTLTIESATIKESNSVKIENQNDETVDTEIEAKIEGGTFDGEVLIDTKNKTNVRLEITGGEFKDEVYVAEDEDESAKNIKITGGTFATDVENYLAEDLHLVKIDGEYVVMDENEYDEYLDNQRDSGRHSYSLKEGKTERDDEEEEPVVTPEPEEEEGPFSDVGKDNPNYDAIVEVYEKGWMAGIADGVFAPNGTLTRGMAVTILWNRAGQPEPASVAPFLDVTSDAWYAKAVAWAYENGITSGYGDTYGPDDFLTTEQFTRMNDIANGRTPEVYVGGAPYATRGWVAGLLVME
ncbi:MAG TPA: S-layer homology domain-containing protein [Firmicutes bacterium]|nr:S-layer homology domain-containing protein [Bacillota bacterium]